MFGAEQCGHPEVSVASALEDSLFDLSARLLDGRFGQHPEFAFEVTPQALASLYRAFLKGEGTIGLEVGAPYSYAAAFGLPLGVCRIVGRPMLWIWTTRPSPGIGKADHRARGQAERAATAYGRGVRPAALGDDVPGADGGHLPRAARGAREQAAGDRRPESL